MRLWDRLTSGPVRAAYPMGVSVVVSQFGSPDQERIQPDFNNAVEVYKTNGVVFGVVQARIALFSEIEFKFQDLATKKLYGSQALNKLETPWPNGTTGELLARMEQDVSLTGNSFIRDGGGYLERLRPDWTTIVTEIVRDPQSDTEVRRVLGYYYDPPAVENREPALYPVDVVAHWSPIPDPAAGFRGVSWLTPVLREVDADTQMTDYKRAYLTNAATPNLLIKYDKRVGQEKVDAIQRAIQARHGGVDNAFRTMVLDEGADTTVVGSNFNQMRFNEVQAAGENRIAVAAGVPGIVAGLKEGLDAATYSNYITAMRRFADLFGRPQWRSACGALSKLVDIPAGSQLWYDTSGVAALREGDKERAETMKVQAETLQSLINAGFTSDSAVLATSANDPTLLKHTGLISVQMQTPGSTPNPGGAQ